MSLNRTGIREEPLVSIGYLSQPRSPTPSSTHPSATENPAALLQSTLPEISIIVPTHNPERTIEQCLHSIASQSFPAKEVIIIDRFSRDRTARIGHLSRARIVQADANRSLARNIGLFQSNSECILFVDSDMMLTSEPLAQCSKGTSEASGSDNTREVLRKGLPGKVQVLGATNSSEQRP